MPAISSLARPEFVDARADCGGEIVNLVFDRSRMTLRWLSTAQRAVDAGDGEALGECFAEMIRSWDIVNDDGTPYQPTAENIALLPARVAGEIIAAMRDSSTPSRAEGNALSAPSSMAPSVYEEPPLMHQNGPEPSPSPEPLASPYPM